MVGLQRLQRSSRDRVLSVALAEELKALDFVEWLNHHCLA